MESANCRRAPDTEPSEWSPSIIVKCEPVKQEPEWGEAAEAGLCGSLEIKDELVVGPESLQQQDIAFPVQSALNSTQEPCKLELEGGEGPRCDVSHKQQFKHGSSFVKLERIHMEDSPTCETCLMTFDCKSSPRNYSCTHSVEESNFYKDACDETAKTYTKCNNCGKQYQQKVNVKTHSKKRLQFSSDAARFNTKETETQYSNQSVLASYPVDKSIHKCDICSEMFTQKEDLIRHLKLIHSVSSKPELNQCDLCNKCKGTDLTIHKRVNISCDICSKQIRSRSELSQHMRVHTGEKPFSCDVCKKQYSQKWSLTRHIKIHMTRKLPECDICQKKFSEKSSLTEHVRIHTGEKPLSCDVCWKQFSFRSALSGHKKIHAGTKCYSCSVCNKQFARKSNLPRHMLTHTGEKLYGCNICERKFAHKEYLTKHLRLHTGDKPFTCDVCKKQFTQKSVLTLHLRTHTDEKLYSCDICKKAFARKDVLSRHRRIHTGIIYLYVSADLS